MTRVQLAFLVLLSVVLVAGMPSSGGAQISVLLPDLAGDVGEWVDVPVTTDDLTGQGVMAYSFTIGYDPDVVSLTGVSTGGTLSEGMVVLANAEIAGELRVAASHTEPLSGSGALLSIRARYVGRGDSQLRWEEFAFNEGDPPSVAIDGSVAARMGLETGIGVSLPKIAGFAGERSLVSVQVEELSGQGVFSYLFTVVYDPTVLLIRGVSTVGTVSDEMSVQGNSPVPGRFTVAGSGASALEGAGTLVDLEVEYVGGGHSPLRWGEFYFNEREPAANPIDGQARADGEVIFNEIHNGPSPTVDWIELLVLADHLDLRGYQVVDSSGEGFGFADDPLWADLRRGTLILVGGNDAPLSNDTDPGDFVISLRNDPLMPQSLLVGGVLDIQEDMDAVQLLRPSQDPAFAILWGGVEVAVVPDYHLDLGPSSPSGEMNVAFGGGLQAEVPDVAAWMMVDMATGTPGHGNGPVNAAWLSDLRGGAQVVEDIEIGHIDLVLPVISGQVGRTTLAPVRVSEVSRLGVFSYLLTIEYDPAIVQITGVSTEGAISAGMSIAANTSVQGQVTVAASGANPLEGSGDLVYLEMAFVGPGTTDLTWAQLQVNEGVPPAKGEGGEATARVGAVEGIGLSLPATTGSVGETVSWAIEVDDVTDRNVTAYLFAVSFDPRVVNVTGFSAAGTISEGMTIEANTGVGGRTVVAASQVGPLSGSGVLLELQAEYVGRGTTDLKWTSFAFNEGEVEAAPEDGRLVVANSPLLAVDDAVEVLEDTPTTLQVLDNDSDPDDDPLTIISVTRPKHGSVGVDPDGTSLIYAPEEDYNGPDSLTYQVSDGIGDESGATVAVSVMPGNDPPVGVDNETTGLQDSPVTIFVLANDVDVDGDRLVIDSVTQPANGEAAIDPGSISITYVPDPGFRGFDSFTYAVLDGQGGASEASVTVEVVRTNDPPVAVDDAVETEEDTPVIVQVLTNDSDADDDELTVSEVGDPANGTVELDAATGEVTYAPTAGFSGSDSFTYTISDPKGGTATATVTVTVKPEQIPPELLSSNPGDAQTGVAVDPLNAGGLMFVFTEPIATSGVEVLVQGDGQSLDWTPTWSADGTQLTLMPAQGSELVPGTVCQVTLTQVLDLKGNDAGAVRISFETEAPLSGDVNADGQVDVRDVILTLRLAAGLPVPTAPSGHVEPTPYERRAADVNEDGTIDEADALLTLRMALGRIATKPAVAQSGEAGLGWGPMVYEGETVEVAVLVEGHGGAHAGNIRLTYSSEALVLQEVEPGNAAALMAVDDRIPGELGISLVSIDGLAGADGAVALVRFHVREGLRAQTRMHLEAGRLFDVEARRMAIGTMDSDLRLVPATYALLPNAPNPFNPTTNIRYQLPEAGEARLVIYDLLGRTVVVLADGHREAGYHHISWDGRDEMGRQAGSGVYLLRLEAGGWAQVRKMTLMR